MAAIAEAVSL